MDIATTQMIGSLNAHKEGVSINIWQKEAEEFQIGICLPVGYVEDPVLLLEPIYQELLFQHSLLTSEG